ncbi:MAG: hypothetical protein ACKO0Z_05190 [Betaproteobacteria bacterium]
MSMYDIGCAVTADLNRYMRDIDESDRRNSAIDDRAKELGLDGQECDPFTVFNLSEALGELDGTAMEALCKLFKDGNTAGAGLVLEALIKDYWQGAAKRQAEREIDNATCHHCWDLGCFRCDPPEPGQDY